MRQDCKKEGFCYEVLPSHLPPLLKQGENNPFAFVVREYLFHKYPGNTTERLPWVLGNKGTGAFTLGNREYCQIIFREQGNSRVDYWDQGNTNLLSTINSSTMNRK